jgi:tetratricopeptide (TPR) repeat protein
VPADALPEPATPSAALKRGLAAFEYGQYHAAAALLRPLVEEERLRGADLVQALRAYGVALFLLGRRGGAEAAFLMLLRRDPRARLDPALVPPEAIAFLDEVRARHGADVARALRRDEPSPWLNLLPPLGQFQNRHQAKAVTLLILEAALLTLDVSTYWVLRQMPRKDGTVASESAFNSLKSLNIVAFSLLAGTVIYGIVDGFYYYRLRAEARERLQARLVPVPLPGGAAVALGAAF